MSFYDLPEFNFPKNKIFFPKFLKKRFFWSIILIIFISSIFGFLAGFASFKYFSEGFHGHLLGINSQYFQSKNKIAEQEKQKYNFEISDEQRIINVVKKVSPAVISIIISKDVPIIEKYYSNPFENFKDFFGNSFPQYNVPKYREKGTEKKEVGGGTGFIVSKDGMILTNAHVISDEKADYTVFTNNGKKYSAKILAIDSLKDLAIIKIEGENFPTVCFGNSDNLQIGQTVIAIGNALGEFRNTVSVGVISGLQRTVTASGDGLVETLEDVIQTDAAINKGNSGGPLLNSEGEVIGVNFAMAQIAQNIGFAIPVNQAKRDVEQVQETGKIIYPFLGIRYTLINDEMQKEKGLPVNYGALIGKGSNNEPAIIPDSSAQEAGLQEGDIILEFNKEKITQDNSLARVIQKYKPKDNITLKILRKNKEEIIEVVLGSR
ncbi:MAG: trypsin-like peptidase domain-containing protein [Patescibacteria group bacterium]|nr:trypsin-like peptidase domain-containing protein [Patescibacteria group bacterium]